LSNDLLSPASIISTIEPLAIMQVRILAKPSLTEGGATNWLTILV